MEEETKCNQCNAVDPPGKRGRKSVKTKSAKNKPKVSWIECDGCQAWYHSVCVRVNEALLGDVDEFYYFCEKCTVRGSLVTKPANPVPVPAAPVVAGLEEVEQLKRTISDLAAQLAKLQTELDSVRSTSRKQHDRLQSKLNSADEREGQCAAHSALISNIGQKLEIIEAGAKLANACSQSVNSCRLAINKIPVREGENVHSIVENVINFLGVSEEMSHVTNCFRLDVKPSKWSDRSLTPTIVAVFDSRDSRDRVLRRYFEKHKDAKLCRLKNAPDLEYRFTINEMLSMHAFRTRNLALRYKQRKAIRSVFVRNDSISVLLPGEQRYTPVRGPEHLLELMGHDLQADESSVFFDARSSDVSSSSHC